MQAELAALHPLSQGVARANVCLSSATPQPHLTIAETGAALILHRIELCIVLWGVRWQCGTRPILACVPEPCAMLNGRVVATASISLLFQQAQVRYAPSSPTLAQGRIRPGGWCAPLDHDRVLVVARGASDLPARTVHKSTCRTHKQRHRCTSVVATHQDSAARPGYSCQLQRHQARSAELCSASRPLKGRSRVIQRYAIALSCLSRRRSAV